MERRARIGIGVAVVTAGGLFGLLTADRTDGSATVSIPTEQSAPPLQGPTQDEPRLGARKASSPGPGASRRDTIVNGVAYDPIRLSLATSAREVFLLEARDPQWAPALESQLKPLVTADLGRISGISNVTVECRTTGCRVSWIAADNSANFSAAQVLTALWGGGGTGKRFGDFTTFYSGPRFDGVDTTDPAALVERLKQRRAEQLAKHRQLYQQGRPRYRTVPPEHWPQEGT